MLSSWYTKVVCEDDDAVAEGATTSTGKLSHDDDDGGSACPAEADVERGALKLAPRPQLVPNLRKQNEMFTNYTRKSKAMKKRD